MTRRLSISRSPTGGYTVRVATEERIGWVRGVMTLRDARMAADVLTFMLTVSGRVEAIRAALALCRVRRVSIFVREADHAQP